MSRLLPGVFAILVVALVAMFWKPLGLLLIDLGLGGASLGIAIVVIVALAGATFYFVREQL